MPIDRGSVRVGVLCDDDHGFTATFMDSWNPLLAVDLGGERRIWRGGYTFQRCTSSGVVEGRNEVVKSFLDSPAEWLLFIDSDMGFDPDALDKLMEAADAATRPIVGGLCFGFGPLADRLDHGFAAIKRPFPTIMDLREDGDDYGFRPRWSYVSAALQRCDATGAAMLLLHRSVLERPEWDDGWFNRVKHPKAQKLWGEDTSFCYRAGQLGYPVFVHAGVQTSHSKVIHVTESVYMSQLQAPPAVDEVAVIVPVLDRPQNAEPFMRSLRASTGLATVYAMASNEEDHRAWQDAGAESSWTPDRVSFAEKVNDALSWDRVADNPAPWIFIVGDDVTFRAGWLDQAQFMARNTGAKVVGTNDLANPRVVAGEHATHLLIAREYIDEHGASWDGPGIVCHEGYRHWFVDDEIVTVAKQRGAWAPCLASVVEHHHPIFGTAPDDETYRRGQRHAGKDKATFIRRYQDSTAKAAA